MNLNFETAAAKYIMEWGEWIEKLRLLAELEIDIKNLDIYIKKLLDLQNPDGGFPKKWIKGKDFFDFLIPGVRFDKGEIH